MERLDRSGWPISCRAYTDRDGTAWAIEGRRGGQRIVVTGPASPIAWRRAVEQAVMVAASWVLSLVGP